MKILEVVVRIGDFIWIDGAWVDPHDSEALLLYKGCKFRFRKNCPLVPDYKVRELKTRFKKLGLI